VAGILVITARISADRKPMLTGDFFYSTSRHNMLAAPAAARLLTAATAAMRLRDATMTPKALWSI
jgi:hypothetical protein